ncbi:ABC transporter ATP-binding protein [Natranaerobius thermophilus]|uniref:ABC transporter related n=1 Tax=Natranaerobius thermophilus (strain ATCC BAA-1301 / DSM 18059 / JW/NM-WN-LF) TaxID=457570 RepID=B2A7C7_NATTJ|nr:ABC transporter ATP-binding protein [Natranaerobius thermophilus]ACB84321.1 ABC transporter related [Natranaerobius thermophilus JW/NM-WN-LF]
MIEINNLTKSFGDIKALDNISTTIETGSIYGLLGPNGAGKTTLIKHIAGIYRPDSGSIDIKDKSVYENPEIKSSLYYIPDDLYFFNQYSIKETAKFYARMYPSWNHERFKKLQDYFPIDINKRVTKLSKGMQKQVAFWLGICTMPDIMILDEPVDGLDPVMRKKVWNLMLQDVAERDTTILVSSHNLRELEEICSHIGIIYNGKIVVERELDNLKTDIHKIQVAFDDLSPTELLQDFEVLHHSKNGSINLLIVRGDKEEILSQLQQANPLILDLLSLTLEEIFIYELGGKGYEIDTTII